MTVISSVILEKRCNNPLTSFILFMLEGFAVGTYKELEVSPEGPLPRESCDCVSGDEMAAVGFPTLISFSEPCFESPRTILVSRNRRGRAPVYIDAMTAETTISPRAMIL